ncbi:MCE family protein [Acidiferrimicrobium sp. IK]|uniref:MCE family protein n=1 Tax=Acidiferrimicrobium sp. IK TaxID=2871700 RepID=UPI0021CB1AFE|nr:MCE family protein [Acidiferrimicrobium sp. IK]MCU4186679.1 MCE family protein [Acidiferrimicrobium sp. IK]
MTAAIASGASFETRQRAAQRRTVMMAGAGVVLVALVAAGVAGMVLSFKGTFSTYASIDADLPPGQPVQPGAQVTYRQVQVGTVAGKVRSLGGGSVRVSLHLQPGMLATIPANVTIAVAPSSVFGVQGIVLAPPAAAVGHLHTGQLLAAASSGSTSLQTGLADINNLLTGLHPAQIDTTLNALSTALHGQGQPFGRAVDELSAYLRSLIPHLPTLNGDITALSPVLAGLSQAIPDLLTTAANSATVAQTVTYDARNLASFLQTGQVVAGQATGLLDGINTTLHAFLTNFLPLLIDVQANPNVIPQTLTNLDTLVRDLLPAFDQGPFVHVTANFYVNDPEDALFAATFLLPQGLEHSEAYYSFSGIMDPPTYTAANCPRYGSEAGPNCGGPVVQSVAAPPASGLPAGSQVVPSPALAPAATSQAASSFVSQAAGTPPAGSFPAVTNMMSSLMNSLVP